MKTIWNVEGPTDLLALLSLNDFPGDESTTALCNANGAKERPKWMAEHIAQKAGPGGQVIVVRDQDKSGLEGAELWSTEIARHGAPLSIKVRRLQLPFEYTETNGKDLRDYLAQGHTYADLLKLAEDTEIVEPPEDGDRSDVQEADDDPHRLARINLKKYATTRRGSTLRFWRGEWWVWKVTHYRKIDPAELRAKITKSVKDEFDRLWEEKKERYEAWRKSDSYDEAKDKGTPEAQKVTKALITNVMDATASLVVLGGHVEQGTWLDDDRNLRGQKPYISMANGILDLDALLGGSESLDEVLLEHDPRWFSPVHLPYEFDVDAACPRWEAFLERNLEMDPERIKLLQEWAGYLLLPDTGHQKFLVMEGEGANGKSVFCAAIEAMLGKQNCSHVPLEVFGERFSRTETLGKLVNIAADVGDLDKVSEGYIKSFTSGDVMFFDRKNMPGLNCSPTARLMLACNQRPRFSDRSSGIWRRILLVPWEIQIPEDQRIIGMDKPEWWERSGELPGILNWAVAGLHRLRNQMRFTQSTKGKIALKDYQDESNPCRIFLSESYKESDDGSGMIECTEIYQSYVRWCKEHGYFPLSDRSFGKEVKRLFGGCIRRRHKDSLGIRRWNYFGIEVNSSTECESESDDDESTQSTY